MYIEDEQSLKSRIDSFLIAEQGGDAKVEFDIDGRLLQKYGGLALEA